jgi:radical SAM superfamily enzyme with C-terminal helix-hairpin-helix motif
MYGTEAIKQYEILPEIHLTRGIPTTVEGVCSRIASKSYISMESAENQKKVLDSINKIFAENSDEQLQRRWIDRSAGVFEYPYATGKWKRFVHLFTSMLTPLFSMMIRCLTLPQKVRQTRLNCSIYSF